MLRSRKFVSLLFISSALSLLALGACTKNSTTPGSDAKSASQPQSESVDAVARGKKVYMANCIACHNMDPKQNGGIGPALWGSSRELLHAKVILNQYPPGYKPKRESNAMAALPHLEGDIDALYAFLNN